MRATRRMSRLAPILVLAAVVRLLLFSPSSASASTPDPVLASGGAFTAL